MEVITQHINKYLSDFSSDYQSAVFEKIFDNLSSEEKFEQKALLKYFYRILEINWDFQYYSVNKKMKCMHLHLEAITSLDVKATIMEFLLCYSFVKSYTLDNKDIINTDLIKKIEDLKSLVAKPVILPEKVSKQQHKKILAGRKLEKDYLNEYESVDINSSLIPKSLINFKVNLQKVLTDIIKSSPFYLCIQDLCEVNSYLVLNTESFKSISKLKLGTSPIFKIIENVILFDCEDRVQRFDQFNFQNLENLNKNHGTNFKNFIIVTFGENENSISSIRSKIDLIRDRFKIPNISSYTILNSEIDFLLNRKESAQLSIEFVGYESSNFWDTFVLETSIRELYELRSIRLMNIYSMCYTDEIKNYIISDLFSLKESSELISSSTKMEILELRDDDIEVLKEALSNTLDVIMNSGTKSIVVDSLSNTPTIVLDEAILRNQNLLSKISVCLGLTKSTKFNTWSDMLNSDLKDFLILSYRDQGRYPNYYFPSLLELELNSECNARAILPSFLFIHYYIWSKYNLYKEYHKLLNHSTRENHFEWNKLKNKIQELKPELKLNINWNLENEYSNSDQRESYKVKVKGQRERTFYSSDLFILADNTKTHHKVVKIDYLLSIDNEDSKVYIQNLDEIQQNINIYDKIVDKKQQEAELEVIRKQFNLSNETAGRLWKLLLKNIANVKGEENLYNELKSIFESKGVKIVSQFHFKNSWINPQCESIAPLSKRVFIELCDYLKIPKIYFVIIQRIRNASKQSSRQSTRQMNQLLKDLFNDGCFDNGKNAREIINNRLAFYKSNHPLDELGIDENYLADNLVTLTELIQPELKLVELENIEKISNE
jgi:hypothetical protein